MLDNDVTTCWLLCSRQQKGHIKAVHEGHQPSPSPDRGRMGKNRWRNEKLDIREAQVSTFLIYLKKCIYPNRRRPPWPLQKRSQWRHPFKTPWKGSNDGFLHSYASTCESSRHYDDVSVTSHKIVFLHWNTYNHIILAIISVETIL